MAHNVSVVHDAPRADRQGGGGVSTALAFATPHAQSAVASHGRKSVAQREMTC